jgi:hypothetical protein
MSIIDGYLLPQNKSGELVGCGAEAAIAPNVTFDKWILTDLVHDPEK